MNKFLKNIQNFLADFEKKKSNFIYSFSGLGFISFIRSSC